MMVQLLMCDGEIFDPCDNCLDGSLEESWKVLM
jgi:hypothetical protein